jgi:F-type H+-transporting ATPase subunit gamma
VDLVDELVDLFLSKRVDRIELVYNHFKNAASQEVRSEVFLPIAPVVEGKRKSLDYILEPSKDEVVAKLLPKVVRLRLYSAILDSLAAEHGARTTAMQVATDNAGELIQELTLMYNKARQAAITSEIIDIVGGSEGLK